MCPKFNVKIWRFLISVFILFFKSPCCKIIMGKNPSLFQCYSGFYAVFDIFVLLERLAKVCICIVYEVSIRSIFPFEVVQSKLNLELKYNFCGISLVLLVAFFLYSLNALFLKLPKNIPSISLTNKRKSKHWVDGAFMGDFFFSFLWLMVIFTQLLGPCIWVIWLEPMKICCVISTTAKGSHLKDTLK